MNPIKIFVSYSHQNNDWVDENGKYGLIPWLKQQLKRENVEFWTDHILSNHIGEEYKRNIKKNIQEADITLLLVSQDFATSDFILEFELPWIMEEYQQRSMKIVPLLIDVLAKNGRKNIPWIFELQTIPNDTKPIIEYTDNDVEWSKVRTQILDVIFDKIEAVQNSTKKDIKPLDVPEKNKNKQLDEELTNHRQAYSVISKAGNVEKVHDLYYEDEELVTIKQIKKNREAKIIIERSTIEPRINGWNSKRRIFRLLIVVLIFCIGIVFAFLIIKNKSYSNPYTIIAPIDKNKIESVDSTEAVQANNILTVPTPLEDKEEKGQFQKNALVQKQTTKVDNNASERVGLSLEQAALANFTESVNGISYDMVAVEGGTFMMGSPNSERDRSSDEKQHKVTLSHYYIGRTEVTQALWKAVMGNNPSNFKGDNLPVEEVGWDDCQQFIKKLNQLTGKKYSFPTEAQWEFAARGGTRSQGYLYAGSNNLNDVAWNNGNGGSKTNIVGQKLPNELGIYDMSGNVYEWCQDWYNSYPDGAQTNPVGPSSGSYRVLRGGGWFRGPQRCRVAFRDNDTPEDRLGYLGFRLALSIE